MICALMNRHGSSSSVAAGHDSSDTGSPRSAPETIRRAAAVHPIVDLQIEYSLISRGPEDKIFPALAELGIAVTAYGVLSRGLLTGSKPTGPGDFRTHLPRFAADNMAANQRLVAALAQLAARRGVTPARLAIAWARSKGPATIIPLVGARTRKQLDDALAALSLELSADDIATLEHAIPASSVAGSRYQEFAMKHLDSER